jgi:DNA replication and repair protein RecF
VGPGSHLILGRNGAGKTSLLEAVYLAATARSFRTGQLEDCVRRDLPTDPGGGRDTPEPAAGWPGDSGFVVRAQVSGPPDAELSLSWSEDGLVRTLDGKSVPLADYLGALPVVVWSGREEEILAGIPERRRRMIDAGLVAERPERVALLGRHRRILAHKRELLRRRHGGLEAWNRLLAEAGSALQRARADWVATLAGRLQEVLGQARRGFPPIDLRYEPSPRSGLEGAEALMASLAEAAEEEMRAGRPCIGAHLDRLSILWGGVDVSRVASAGERKALGLLLSAAQAALLESAGRPPSLLVDDVDAELDLPALEAVFAVLAQGRQVLATTSREEVAEHLSGATVWRPLEGAIRSSKSIS